MAIWAAILARQDLKHYRGQALIIDIQGGRRGSAEIDKIIDGKIIGNHNQADGRPLGRLPQGSPKG
jgi:hypothetical protein